MYVQKSIFSSQKIHPPPSSSLHKLVTGYITSRKVYLHLSIDVDYIVLKSIGTAIFRNNESQSSSSPVCECTRSVHDDTCPLSSCHIAIFTMVILYLQFQVYCR